MKVTLYAIAAGVCLAFGVYALAGVWTAASLYGGDRAMANYKFWGPLATIFIVAGIFFGYRAIRSSLLRLLKSLDDDTN